MKFNDQVLAVLGRAGEIAKGQTATCISLGHFIAAFLQRHPAFADRLPTVDQAVAADPAVPLPAAAEKPSWIQRTFFNDGIPRGMTDAMRSWIQRAEAHAGPRTGTADDLLATLPESLRRS